MPTIKEVAKRAKVSVGTVSNVLSETAAVSSRLRKRVEAAIRELDYHPNHFARSLKTKHSKILGIVIPDIADPFFPKVVRGAEDAASKRGYSLFILDTDDQPHRERQAVSMLRSRRVDGVLLIVAPTDGDLSHIHQMIEAGTPIVLLDRVPAGISVDSVAIENVAGARECVRHLITMGHRDIAIINGPRSLSSACERLQGYTQALRAAKIAVRQSFVCYGDFRTDSAYEITRKLFTAKKPPSALFICNGMMTAGALMALDELGMRCPDDIAIVTFDELPVPPVFRPQLTALSLPTYEIGCKGADLLIDRLEGKLADSHPVHIQLRAELRIRESSLICRPKAQARAAGPA